MSVFINYIGHSGFFIAAGEAGGLIDPFITHNPSAVCLIKYENIKDILVTHGHMDHLGDSIQISRDYGVPLTTIFELARYCSDNGANASGVGIGARIAINGGYAKFCPAFHSSSTPDGGYAGMPASVMLELDGVRVYHAGDNCLNMEMKVIGETMPPDIALLPIGGTYTMGIDDAVVAAKWLGAKTVIPMHYNTFPTIVADEEEFKRKAEAAGLKCVILTPGDSIEL